RVRADLELDRTPLELPQAIRAVLGAIDDEQVPRDEPQQLTLTRSARLGARRSCDPPRQRLGVLDAIDLAHGHQPSQPWHAAPSPLNPVPGAVNRRHASAPSPACSASIMLRSVCEAVACHDRYRGDSIPAVPSASTADT